MASYQVNNVRITVESLEARETPVIGLSGTAPAVPLGSSGGDFDGVVRVEGALGGTGAILSPPAYILTAAHIIGKDKGKGGVDFPAAEVKFEHARFGKLPDVITFEVPAGPEYFNVPSGGVSNWDPSRPVDHDDIGIITLPDQTAPGPGRVMVAPFRATPFGGNRYGIFTGPPIGQQFSVVGYGEIGEGYKGQTTDRVDRVIIPGPRFGADNTFTITVGSGAAARTTAEIPQLADARTVATALAQVAAPGDYVVDNKKLPPGVWDIRSVDGKGDLAHGGGVTRVVRNDAGSGVSVVLQADNRWPGGSASGTKRAGQNEIDRPNSVQPRILEYDFDDTAGGVGLFGSPGLGAAEAGLGRGDSGGPALVRVAGVPQILGVASYGKTLVDDAISGKAAGVTSPDVTQYVFEDGSDFPDGSVGEWGGYTHVNAYMADFVTPRVERPVDWVFDMEYQTYGTSMPSEKLEITIQNIGGYVHIAVANKTVGSPDIPVLDGVYARIKASTIKTLTLRGTDDDETFKFVGDPGFTGQIYISGKAGADEVIYDDSGAAATRHDYTFATDREPGYDLRLHRAAGTPLQPLAPIDTVGIDKYTLIGSPGIDHVRVDAAPAILAQGLFVEAGPENDEVYVGSSYKGLSEIAAKVFVHGGDKYNLLTYDDKVSDKANTYVLGLPEAQYQPAWDLRFTSTGSPGAVYSRSFGRYDLRAGTGFDMIRIEATVAPTDVSAGAGNDTILIGTATDGLNKIASSVSVWGDAGVDDLIIDDRAGPAGARYEIGKGSVSRIGGPIIFNQDAIRRTLHGAPGGNLIRIAGNLPDPEAKLAVNAGPGNDTVTVSDAAFKFDDILGAITVDGMGHAAGGKDQLVFGDTGHGTGDTYTVRPNRVEAARLPAFDLTHTGFEAVELDTGPGPDTVGLDGLTLADRPVINTSSDYDRVRVLSGAVRDPDWRNVERLDLVGGTLTVDAAPLTFTDVRQTGGVLDGPATLTATTSLGWSGGTMQGGGATVTGTSSNNVLDGSTKTLLTRLLDLSGVTRWTVGDIYGSSGRVAVRGYGELRWSGGATTGTGTITNSANGVVKLLGDTTAPAPAPSLVGWVVENPGLVTLGRATGDPAAYTRVDFGMGTGGVLRNTAAAAEVRIQDTSNVAMSGGQLGLLDILTGRVVKAKGSGLSLADVDVVGSSPGSLTVAGISRLKIKGQTELIGPTDLPQVDPDRVMAFAGPFTFVDAAQPVIYAGGWVEGFGEVVTGRLTVRGSVRPGNLNYGGRLTVRGNYTQTNTSSLDLELGKPGGPDQLVVAGASAPIYLDGMLNLNFNGFTPTFGTPLLLLDNQSNQPIVGYYVNYAPNQVFSVNGYHTGSKK